jgi:hypothetical protein
MERLFFLSGVAAGAAWRLIGMPNQAGRMLTVCMLAGAVLALIAIVSLRIARVPTRREANWCFQTLVAASRARGTKDAARPFMLAAAVSSCAANVPVGVIAGYYFVHLVVRISS